MKNILANAKAHLPGHSTQEHQTLSKDPLHTTDSSYSKEVYSGDRLPSHLVGKAPLHNAVGTTTVIEEETLIGDEQRNNSRNMKPIVPPLPTQTRNVPSQSVPPPAQYAPSAPAQYAPSAPSYGNAVPSISRQVVEKPLVLHETLRNQERIEVQPVIHREREQKEVHQIVQPMREREVLQPKLVNTTLADEIRAPIIQDDTSVRGLMGQQTHFASRDYAPLQTETINRPAIIEEHIKRTIVEEVQPVLYKETVIPTLVRQTLPIYEKVVETPVLYNETRSIQDLGTRFGANQFNEGLYQSLERGFVVAETTVTPNRFYQ